MRILILSRYGNLGASSRLRLFQYIPYLEKNGFCIKISALFEDALLANKYRKGRYEFFAVLKAYIRRFSLLFRSHHFELILIEKESLPWMPAFIESSLLKGVPYVLDFDDAIFHNYDHHSSKLVRKLLGRRIDHLMARANLVIAGNRYLANRAFLAGASAVELIPTVIDLSRYEAKEITNLASENVVLRIVWIGSPSTVQYLIELHKPLKLLAEKHQFILRVIGANVEMSGVQVELFPWSEQSEVELIRSSDIGVMPLLDSPWENGKCGYKLIQYMACGLPVIASPVGANLDIVQINENGYLASTPTEWLAALESLLISKHRRVSMGKVGRQLVEERYCIQKTAPLLLQRLKEAVQGS